MKNFLIWYWVFGCLLVGIGYGMLFARCPDSIKPSSPMKVIGEIIEWPVIVVAAMIAATLSEKITEPTKCHARKPNDMD